MDADNEFAGDETTLRTRLAMDAEREAQKAQMDVLVLRRTVKRMRGWYAAFAGLVIIAGAGWAVRNYVDNFETHAHALKTDARQDDVEKEMAAIREQLRGANQRLTRIDDKMDRLLDHFMPSRDRRSDR